MTKLPEDILETTSISDHEAFILIALLVIKADNDRYAYSLCRVANELAPQTFNISLATVRQALKKFHNLGVIKVRKTPIRSAEGPARYPVEVIYPRVIECLASKRRLEQTYLVHMCEITLAKLELMSA